MADEFTIRPATGTWVVRAGGAVLGESENALEVSHGGATTIYFPQDDIATVFLDPSDKTDSMAMGEVSYHSIVTKSTTLHNSAWKISAPTAAAAPLADHLAFETGDLVAVEKL